MIMKDMAPGIGHPKQPSITFDLEGKGLPSTPSFWSYLDKLVRCPIIIDRPRKSSHPRYPEIVYPLDYGYLEGTSAIDGGGVDLWLGTSGTHEITAVILTIDLFKRDAEIKVALGCTDDELQIILDFQKY